MELVGKVQPRFVFSLLAIGLVFGITRSLVSLEAPLVTGEMLTYEFDRHSLPTDIQLEYTRTIPSFYHRLFSHFSKIVEPVRSFMLVGVIQSMLVFLLFFIFALWTLEDRLLAFGYSILQSPNWNGADGMNVAFLLVVFAWVALLKKQYILSGVFLGVTLNLHGSLAVIAAVITGFSVLGEGYFTKTSIKECAFRVVKLLVGMIVFGIPILWLLFTNRSSGVMEIPKAFVFEHIYMINSQALSFFDQVPKRVFGNLVLLFFAMGILIRKTSNFSKDRAGMLFGALVSILVILATSFITVDFFHSLEMAKLCLLRGFLFIPLFTYLIILMRYQTGGLLALVLLGLWLNWESSVFSIVFFLLASGTMLLHLKKSALFGPVILVTFVIGLNVRKIKEVSLPTYQSTVELISYLKTNTDSKSYQLFHPTIRNLVASSHRAAYVTLTDATYGQYTPSIMNIFIERLNNIYPEYYKELQGLKLRPNSTEVFHGIFESRFLGLSDSDLERLHGLGVEYLITYRSSEFKNAHSLERVFENDRYSVYKISNRYET